MSVVGSRIKQLRERMGLSQVELAERIGLNNSVLSRIESGKRPIEDHELNLFADFFDVDADYLLGRTNYTKYESDANIDPEWTELFEKVKQKGAELEATALLRSATKLTKDQMRDILRVLEMIEKEEDE